MKESVFLKPKEARRVHVMELLVGGKSTVSEAAQLLTDFSPVPPLTLEIYRRPGAVKGSR